MLSEDKLNENIISMLGIESLPDDRKIAMLKKMSDLLQKRIALNILKQLGAEEKEAFVEATAEGNDDKLKEILDKHKIDMVDLIEEETVKLKDELKSKTDELGV